MPRALYYPLTAPDFKVGDKVDYYWTDSKGIEHVWKCEITRIGPKRVGVRTLAPLHVGDGKCWGGGVAAHHLRYSVAGAVE